MSGIGRGKFGVKAEATVRKADGGIREHADLASGLSMGGIFTVDCYDADRNLKWSESAHNIVTTEGLDAVLTEYFKGSGYTAAWYAVPIDVVTAPAAGNTYANTMSDANLEFIGYSEGARQAWTGGAVSAGSVDNSASKAVYSITSSATIYGAALVDTATKGSAASGVLHSRADFASSRAVINTDTLEITYTLTAADDGV